MRIIRDEPPEEPEEPDEEDHAVARSGDPETSWEAAHSVKKIRESQQAVYALFLWPMTDEQMIVRAHELGLKQSVSGLRTRRSELVTKKLLRDSGNRLFTASGRRSIVWERTCE